MAQVYVKYNPYRMETEIKTDGKKVSPDSILYKLTRGKRLQEWIGKFPARLVEDLNTVNFEVEFYGMPMDWDDFEDAFKYAQQGGIIKKLSLKFIKGRLNENINEEIVKTLKDLQSGPVEEFRDSKLTAALKNINNTIFPINVVATMSSGKSTLINAMLGKRLMPAKNEACTATITEILDNDSEQFEAVAYNDKRVMIQSIQELTYEKMVELNDNPEVSRIKAKGNIPFLDAKSTALKLVDTPGPNNSGNQMHKDRTYSAVNNDSNNMILYVLNATQLETNDDKWKLGKYRNAPFAQEVITRKKDSDSRIALGTIYHLGDKTETEVELDLNSLSMHTFITGSTGSGKSNAVYHLLSELRKKNIPFLVVEPAKGEYKEVFKDVRCFGTNPKAGELLKINPFSFPEEVHVLEHIDRIVEIFNVCWPMYAAMPAVLKDSIERAYISAGWELDVSENTKVPGLFPTFDDVLRELDVTIRESAYAEDTKGDYIGSLSTRLKSLTNGINGRVFVSDEQELSELFDKSAIIDISRIGSMETKSLIMGLVVLKLQEYRMAKESKMNSPLKHITVLEEAHNLLKKTSTEQSSESSNMVGKSVEMLTNAIAEIRTYGEGFVIVDQAPDLLDTAAIRNTNTKIVLRLPESTDRKITGGAISLKEPQFDELSKLPTGVAAVYQNDWQEAVLCALPRYEERNYGQEKSVIVPAITRRKEKNDRLLHLLLKDIRAEKEKKKVIDEIVVCNASAKIKKDLILNVENRNQLFEWAVADFIRKNYEYSDVFRGTGTSRSAEEAELVLMQNLAEEFSGFNNHEMQEILYCICLNEHEKYPDNKSIEELKNNIYRKRQ